MLANTPIETLLRRFLEGEHHLLAEIARRPDVPRYVHHRLQRAARTERLEVQEICQRVYLDLWRQASAERIVPIDNAWGYVCRAIDNAIRKELRRLRTQRRDAGCSESGEYDLNHVIGPTREASEEVGRREQIERVLQLMSRRERLVWRLFRRGLNWNEIGAELGIGATAARMRFQRTVRRLRAKIQSRPISVRTRHCHGPARTVSRSPKASSSGRTTRGDYGPIPGAHEERASGQQH